MDRKVATHLLRILTELPSTQTPHKCPCISTVMDMATAMARTASYIRTMAPDQDLYPHSLRTVIRSVCPRPSCRVHYRSIPTSARYRTPLLLRRKAVIEPIFHRPHHSHSLDPARTPIFLTGPDTCLRPLSPSEARSNQEAMLKQ